MKHFGICAFALLICLFESRAQTIQGASQVSLPSATSYTVVSQNANSRVWQSESYEAGQNGLIVTNIHSYEELASGLNYLKNGAWTASEEKISVLPDGTGAATNGQHQIFFPADLSGGHIEMVTPDGKQIFSQPLELSYFDGTNTVVLAELTNSVGIVVGNNQVVYPNAFNGLKADIRSLWKIKL
jgi:archaellum component FlaF (FlaF/FlaG flagellin family)